MSLVFHELGALAVAGAVCSGILLLGEQVRRRMRPRAEITRKMVHVLTGLVACSFPWIFDSRWSVLILCAVFLVVLGWSSLHGTIRSVNGVWRRSGGGVWFPAAVAVAFWLSGGRPELFVPPILVLTVSDPTAALVGQRWGRSAYRPLGERKTFEGSLAFLLTAFACLLSTLTCSTEVNGPACLVVALTVALLATVLEAASWMGCDNLTVPLGVGWALSTLTSAPMVDVGLVGLALATGWVAMVVAGERVDGAARNTDPLGSGLTPDHAAEWGQ